MPVRLKERERTHFELSLNHVFSLLTRELCVGILGVWFFDFPFPIASKYLSQDPWGGEVARPVQELGTFGPLGLIARTSF